MSIEKLHDMYHPQDNIHVINWE